MNKFVGRYNKAKQTISELKAGEWEFKWNRYARKFLHAENDKGEELWVANGPWFIDIEYQNSFGLLFRHWVYWRGIRGAKKLAMKERNNVS